MAWPAENLKPGQIDLLRSTNYKVRYTCFQLKKKY